MQKTPKFVFFFLEKKWKRCQKLFKIWMINADTDAYCIALDQSECLIFLISVLIEYKIIEVKLVPGMQPRDTNNQEVLYPLVFLCCKLYLYKPSLSFIIQVVCLLHYHLRATFLNFRQGRALNLRLKWIFYMFFLIIS